MYLIKQRIRAHLFVNFALYKYLIIIIIIMLNEDVDIFYNKGKLIKYISVIMITVIYRLYIYI